MIIMAYGPGDEKWVKHYSSKHQILLVGEGDFSFSLCLARSFGSAFNIYASSFDKEDELVKKYKKARSNLANMKKLGASLLHEVDATKMNGHSYLRNRKFDRIVFNFPHAGFYGKEDNPEMIKIHQKLVRGFFQCARYMLMADGEIHVSHKDKPPYCDWNLEELANECFLELIGRVEFNKHDYLGYENKRGCGPRSDETFHLGECSTFKFRLSLRAKRILAEIQRNPVNQRLGSYDLGYPRQTHTHVQNIEDFPVQASHHNHYELSPGSSLIYRLSDCIIAKENQNHHMQFQDDFIQLNQRAAPCAPGYAERNLVQSPPKEPVLDFSLHQKHPHYEYSRSFTRSSYVSTDIYSNCPMSYPLSPQIPRLDLERYNEPLRTSTRMRPQPWFEPYIEDTRRRVLGSGTVHSYGHSTLNGGGIQALCSWSDPETYREDFPRRRSNLQPCIAEAPKRSLVAGPWCYSQERTKLNTGSFQPVYPRDQY